MRKIVYFIVFSGLFDFFSRNLISEEHNSKTEFSIISISAVGDIMMGSDFPEPILPPDDGKELFKEVKSQLNNSDITIGNLEGTLCDNGKPTKNIDKGCFFAFRTPTNYVSNLVDAGFDVLNLANNHINDFGHRGIVSTRKTLKNAGLKYTGLLGDIAYLTVKNKSIAIIGFSPFKGSYNMLDIKSAESLVARLKRERDIVIVTFHGGAEGKRALHTKDTFEFFLGEPRGNVVRFARSVIDAGADLVLGHGPHVPRAIEIYRERLIAYSLGNFCTYGRFNLKGECGISLILQVNLDTTGKFIDGRIVPVVLKPPGISVPDSLNRSIELIKKLCKEDFPLSAPYIDEKGFIRTFSLSDSP